MVREMFVPLEHPPCHAQFGQAWAFIGGKKRRIHYFLMSASQRRHIHKGISRGDHGGVLRRACVGVRLPGRSAAEHPVRQLEDCRREDTGRRTSQAHEYVHGASVALPVQRQVRQSWQGQRQGECQGMVGYGRRNFLVPIPRATADELNRTWRVSAWSVWTPGSGGTPEHWRAYGADLGAAACAGGPLRRERQARHPCELAVTGALPHQRLCIRTQGRAGERLRR